LDLVSKQIAGHTPTLKSVVVNMSLLMT